MPQCARCGATSPDRTYIGFASGDETYCVECLSPEEIEMVLGFASMQEPRAD